jgi:dipeptidyl aminopeptidase/acylaminoacyl peptidase
MVRFWKEGGMKGTVEELLGGTPAQVPDAYARASPLSYVRPDGPPILTIHGDMDAIVPFKMAEEALGCFRSNPAT